MWVCFTTASSSWCVCVLWFLLMFGLFGPLAVPVSGAFTPRRSLFSRYSPLPPPHLPPPRFPSSSSLSSPDHALLHYVSSPLLSSLVFSLSSPTLPCCRTAVLPDKQSNLVLLVQSHWTPKQTKTNNRRTWGALPPGAPTYLWGRCQWDPKNIFSKRCQLDSSHKPSWGLSCSLWWCRCWQPWRG